MKLGSAFYTSWRRKVASHPIVHVLSLSLLLPTSSFFLSSLSLTINPNPFCCCRSSFYCFLQLFWVWGIGNPLPTPSPPPTSRQSGSVNARDCAWSKWHWKDPTPPPPQCFLQHQPQQETMLRITLIPGDYTWYFPKLNLALRVTFF